MVIARVWHGVVPRSKGAKYLAYLKRTGVRDFSRTPGNLGATIWTRSTGKNIEFVIISRWRSMEAIRRFAGGDAGRARYYPKDSEFLLGLEPRVKHYRVAFELRTHARAT